jgi:nitrite reductase/ring-hydroxylating ferredoxin subunit
VIEGTPHWRALCPAAAIPRGQARGFPSADPGLPGVFAVHHHRDGILIYRNACPHLGVPLDWAPGNFLNSDGTRILCATHGAEFRIADGYCLRGPCRGETLVSLPCIIVDGMVMVAGGPG